MLDLSTEQQHAIDICCDLSERIVSITGSAGTGKTLVLGRVHAELHNVVLCAPTGRAAKRIQELTGITSKTIHRLLEFPMPDEDGDPLSPRRNKFNPLDEHVVIVDEASMLSPTLFRQLLDALPPRGCVRFFGDNNQLPPIEEGTPPFVDILKRRPSITLTYNYRSNDSIISNALRILRGMIPLRNDRFEIIYTAEPLKQLLHFLQLGAEAFTDDQHQIIMPTRTGRFGTQRINPSLQLVYNRNGPFLLLKRLNVRDADLTVRARDKFLWVKNDYQLNLFNGEIGRIDQIDEESGDIHLALSDRVVHVPPTLKTYSPYHGSLISYDPRKQIELGYAITTHKAQGSEFDTIIYCMSGHAPFLLGRRNFYTGITRARNQVYIICDRRAMHFALRKNGK
jgi:exodeoxyribonuclease V alpha subunit